MELGEWLQRKRHEAELTQADVAAKAHATPPTISNIERGHYRPGLGLLSRFCEAVGADIDEALRVAGRCGVCGSYPGGR